jgi:hypothetical protein
MFTCGQVVNSMLLSVRCRPAEGTQLAACIQAWRQAVSGKSQLRVQQGRSALDAMHAAPRNISLTFFPKEGASGFFADHFGDVAEAGDILLWYVLKESQRLARTIAAAW